MKTYWDSSALVEALHDTNKRARIKPGENGTRSHSLAEVFSTLTKGVKFRYSPQDAAKMAEDLAKDLDFVEVESAETVAVLKKASYQGVRGARIYDLIHAEAAAKYGAEELLTLDTSGFGTLKLSLAVKAP